MELEPRPADRLLLVEDCHNDSHVIRHCLGGRDSGYRVTVAETLAEGLDHIKRGETDIILLDLTLPDSNGIETLVRVAAVAQETPIVVLTGHDDDELAMGCIQAGAQDFLSKAVMTPHNLRRVIGYALGRYREAQLKTLRMALERYRGLSSARSETSVTRALSGARPIRDQKPAEFAALHANYRVLLEEYMKYLVVKKDKPREGMEILATRLGDLGATPRDLIDIHIATLDQMAQDTKELRTQAYTADSRLFALEMMGLLVEYYRIGFRRLFPERPYL